VEATGQGVGDRSLKAHFEWPADAEVDDGACATAADELVLLLDFLNAPPTGGHPYAVSTQVLSSADDLLVESSVDLAEEEGTLESPLDGRIETATEQFPHLLDCLGGPSGVDPVELLTIEWTFDSEVYVDLCRPLGLD